MNTTRTFITGALGAVLLTAASAFAAMPGQGWDIINSHDINSGMGQPVPDGSRGNVGMSLQEAPDHGFDLLNSKDPSL